MTDPMNTLPGNPMKDPLVSCKYLNFSYAGRQVLKEISLDFYSGEFVAVLGRNGAGKSTLLSCLLGLKPCSAAHLLVGGLDPGSAGRRDIARRVSFVPQEHEDMFPFSVLEVVVMGRTVFLGSFGAPGNEDETAARAVLEELQISHLAQRTYTDLSGGEKQMVLLARALVQSRKIIFLDEPTNHLDYSNRFRMLAWLKALTKDHNSCVVACLHDPNHALMFADRAVLLHRGRILDSGPVQETLTGPAISRLYGMAAWQSRGPGPPGLVPAFVHPDFKGRVLLLTGESGQGKTTLLHQVIKENPHLDFGGFTCPGFFKEGLRFQSDLHCLATKQSAPFARRANNTPTSHFLFDEQGMALARTALDPLENSFRHCVVVDEVGRFELKGKNFAPYLSPLLSVKTLRHIWVVRTEFIEAVCRRWLLADPVIVRVSDPNAAKQINRFLNNEEHDV